MQLTQKQESLISRYLRDLAAQLDGTMPAAERDQQLRRIQARVYRELESLAQGQAVSDDDVAAVLWRVKPGDATEKKGGAGGPKPAKPEKGEESLAPIWLGVCAFNAERFGIAPWTVRLFAVLLGLVTGPIAVLCYLAGFAELYLTSERAERPEIAYRTLALRSLGPLAVAIFIRWGAYKILDVVAYGYEKAFNEPVPPLGKWDWLAHYDGTFFFLLCLSVVPVSVLSGLPLANAWGHSLKRLAQALVALYFVALSFGIASILVGLILDRVQPYMQ